ncbi:MAG: hypothetical protein KKD90_06230 [Candidatus Omnitrophica bacterium]|nr:hypothetical protein [Candidatus Omnitrophota bacterium]
MSKILFMKESYSKGVRCGNLEDKYLRGLISVLKDRRLIVDKIEKKEVHDLGISENLARLPIYIVKGDRNWQGLAVGFPGNTEDLTTNNVGTPFLRILLYPILDLFQKINDKYFSNNARCLYIMGARFPDVFIRKFKLLSVLTPHLIVITNDLVKTIRNASSDKVRSRSHDRCESRYQQVICDAMKSENGLTVPTLNGKINIKYISHEVQTGEGTKNPERLDILGFDTNDHSLVAFEIKGPSCGEEQFNNLFFQGLEHRNWIEDNKMAIKLVSVGPKGKNINTKKRVRLILGFCNEKVPPLFHSLRNVIRSKDKYIKIDFVNLALKNGQMATTVPF